MDDHFSFRPLRSNANRYFGRVNTARCLVIKVAPAAGNWRTLFAESSIPKYSSSPSQIALAAKNTKIGIDTIALVRACNQDELFL